MTEPLWRRNPVQELPTVMSRCLTQWFVQAPRTRLDAAKTKEEKTMPQASGSGNQRDLRIDFFRGLALIFIFVDHVPDNAMGRLTLRNFGFADAAEVFVLLAGFSAFLAYSRTFETQGFKAGLSRVTDRVRDIYIWHLMLLLVCGIGLTLAAAYFGKISYVRNIGVHVFADNAMLSTVKAALLINQPNMLNILPLYIVLLLFWLPFVLWLMQRNPWQALVLSVGLWAVANVLSFNLPSQQHSKGWVFNPFAWQLLITIGAMTAHFARRGAITYSRALLALAVGYLVFAFLYAAPWTQIPGLEKARLFAPNMLGNIDKTYLSPWRLANVVALGYVALILLSPQSRWLTRSWATGIGRCGQHSLEIFCLGTILSFAGWVFLVEAGNKIVLQILVSIVGIGIMWGTAWALSLRKRGGSDWEWLQSLGRGILGRRSGRQLQA